MKNIDLKISEALKKTGKAVIKNLPELAKVIPVAGDFASKVLADVLPDEYRNQLSEKGSDVGELMGMMIRKGVMSEEDINQKILCGIKDYLKDETYHNPAYMSGVILYTAEDSIIDESLAEKICGVFSEDYYEEHFDEEEEQFQQFGKKIQDFRKQYAAQAFREEDGYYATPISFVINFDECVPINHDAILSLIYNLNGYLGVGMVFSEYVVFA